MAVPKLFKVRTEKNYDGCVLDMRKETVKEFGAPILGYGSYTSEWFDLIGAMIPLLWPANYDMREIYLFKGSGTERSQIPITQKTMFIERIYPNKSKEEGSSRVTEVGPMDSDEEELAKEELERIYLLIKNRS